MSIESSEPNIETTILADAGGVNIASVSAGGALKIDGSAVTQPISGTITVGNSTGASAVNIQDGGNTISVDGNVSLGNSTGKTIVMKTGTLVTTATTADQVILTYTVTSGKTLFLQYYNITCGLTSTPSNYNTPIIFGNISLESPAGIKLITWRHMGPQPVIHDWGISEPEPISSGTVIRIVCTPGLTTSTTWVCNLGGYER